MYLQVYGFVVVVLISSLRINAFFDFLKSSSSSSPTSVHVSNPIPTNYDHFRGISERNKPKYQQDPFTCDQDQTKLSNSAVNDGYCDCLDHSDEPGTSACSRGTFHCINKGYKTVIIPSSRVDDQICDCCDGSDEGIYVKCLDTCQQMAAFERSAVDRLIQSYKIGSQQKQLWENSAREKLEREVNQVHISPEELENLRQQLNTLNEAIKKQEDVVNTKENQLKDDIKVKINRLLKLSGDSQNLNYIAGFLSSLTLLLNLDDIQLTNYLTDNPPSPPKSHRSAAAEIPNGEVAEDYDDYEFHQPEEPQPSSNEVIDSCDLTELTGNAHLRVLCDAKNKPASIIAMIYSIIADYHPYQEMMLIVGYYRLSQTFTGAVEFAQHQITSFGPESCPAEFEKLINYCDTKELVKDLITHYETVYVEEETQQLKQLKQQKEQLNTQITDFENLENTAKRAKEELDKYSNNQLQFYALKGQTFEVNDGKFSYSLTILENVKQKEIGGYNTVTLGDFHSLEESNDHGHSYKMKFRNGQHCHAFGPRSAEVTVICGEKNALKSAAEPSTCFYALTFESPAACTEEFAATNGLLD